MGKEQEKQQVPSQPSKPKWIIFESVAYFLGHGLHWYSREGRIFNPKAVAPGVSCVAVDNAPGDVDHVGPKTLDILADRSFDWVFIDHWADEDPGFGEILPKILRKLKPSGHCIRLSKTGYQAIPKMALKTQVCDKDWYLSVYKNSQWKGVSDPRPRVCISRYGAFGDLVMITPLIRKFSEDGYHVTVNAQAYSASVLRENPFVDNLLIQEREAIPNHWLGEYWDYWKSRYDKYINLSESIEGGLLKVENRRDFYTSKEFRHSTNNVNYHDRTMALGGYPEETGTRGELYFTKSEEKKVKKFIDSARAAGKRFIVMCPLRGSSHHKKYPLLGAVMNRWLKDKPDALVILTGGPESTPLVFEHPQVLSFVNSTWTIRELMLMTKYVDVILGPETGMLNAAACWDTAKIVYLSHSTSENLTKYWTNTTVLEPDTSRAPCYPCHQLHYSLDSCPLAQLTDKDNRVIDTLPVCAAGAVGPDKILSALNSYYPSML